MMKQHYLAGLRARPDGRVGEDTALSKLFSLLQALVNAPGSILLFSPKHEQAPSYVVDPRVYRPLPSNFIEVIQVDSSFVINAQA